MTTRRKNANEKEAKVSNLNLGCNSKLSFCRVCPMTRIERKEQNVAMIPPISNEVLMDLTASEKVKKMGTLLSQITCPGMRFDFGQSELL